MEGSRRSGRRGRRPSELLACGCAAADANWAAPAVARPPVQSQLMQDQNASCKLAPPTKMAQPRDLSGATTNPPARGRVVEATAGRSKVHSQMEREHLEFGRLKRGRCNCLALPRCCGASGLGGAIPRRSLCNGGSNTASTSVHKSRELYLRCAKQQQRWRRGALQPCCCRP